MSILLDRRLNLCLNSRHHNCECVNFMLIKIVSSTIQIKKIMRLKRKKKSILYDKKYI
jgi:hypothetical protein